MPYCSHGGQNILICLGTKLFTAAIPLICVNLTFAFFSFSNCSLSFHMYFFMVKITFVCKNKNRDLNAVLVTQHCKIRN